MFVLYCQYAHEQGYENGRVRSRYRDVFFILLHHAKALPCTNYFHTGSDNNKHLINITEPLADYTLEYSTALTAVYAFTHCVSTMAFKGVGNTNVLSLPKPMCQRVLARLGEEWTVSEEMVNGLEALSYNMYGKSRSRSLDEVRSTLIKEKCNCKGGGINVHLCSLPPCRKALLQHIRRTTYQLVIWRRADNPVSEIRSSTDGHGWMKAGNMMPVWFEGNVFQTS